MPASITFTGGHLTLTGFVAGGTEKLQVALAWLPLISIVGATFSLYPTAEVMGSRRATISWIGLMGPPPLSNGADCWSFCRRLIFEIS
jgi:hypothetical protein